jgi:hypothetical protein
MDGDKGGLATAPGQQVDGSAAGKGVPIAWKPGEELDVRTWVRIGHRFGGMARCSPWLLGDWIRYGNTRWGEKYREAMRITGYDVQSLRNFAYVAGHVDPSRRRDELSWSHHAEVCALSVPEQERWLDVAVAERLSVADLRVELRAARRGDRRQKEVEEQVPADPPTVTCPECGYEFAA